MPPEVLHFRPLLPPLVQLSSPVTTQPQENQPSGHKVSQETKRMGLTKRELIPILVLILSVVSVIRLLSIIVSTSSSSHGSSGLYPGTQHRSFTLNAPETGSSKKPRRPPRVTTLTKKEFRVLSNLIAQKVPCNILIFGFHSQYLTLSSLNADGSTIFLEDDPHKISKVRFTSNNTRIYRTEYNMSAKDAYELLKEARQNSACAPTNPKMLRKSKCKLALKNLPAEVYEKNWDVVVVDGPNGDSPESPGRMAPIYTASVLARAANVSNVVVHDVDRTIEKWFSWEFLCDENLLHSKGKLWHFRINHFHSTRFCTDGTQTKQKNHSARDRDSKTSSRDLKSQ
ncbi:probable methyltransferase At1g27930 [Neltuma alba]|uniref:probable methyltransferase At1g27930 n=1 Tax=Neltuma alba TaxID=207710 RepID=UPI0010A59209|nr:probable methyltransferase At1g27930 [Prosopis alba]